MRRLWLLFAQTVTVLLAVWFVVLTLKPGWFGARPGAGIVSLIEAPAAPPGTMPPGSLRDAAARASLAVVSINTSKAPRRHPHAGDPWFRFFFGDGAAQPQTGLGSGVIVSPEGYLLTNNHVVEDADEIEVVLSDGRRARARVIGTDPETDLAVLRIPLDRLPVIALGNAEQLRVGDPVLAIGNPFGVGQTVTGGIVSALGRNRLGINTFENFIQTDAAINPGNSGGALVDANGHLMGINTAIYSRSGGSMGIGFAIPVNIARQVMEQLITTGAVTRGWIGVEPQELTPELAETFGVRDARGVIITGVLQNGPAARAGLRPGDVIAAINDGEVSGVADLLGRVAALTPGMPARLRIVRAGGSVDITVTPGARPRQRAEAFR